MCYNVYKEAVLPLGFKILFINKRLCYMNKQSTKDVTELADGCNFIQQVTNDGEYNKKRSEIARTIFL